MGHQAASGASHARAAGPMVLFARVLDFRACSDASTGDDVAVSKSVCGYGDVTAFSLAALDARTL